MVAKLRSEREFPSELAEYEDRAVWHSVDWVSPGVEEVIFSESVEDVVGGRNYVETVTIRYSEQVTSWFSVEREKRLVRASTTPRKFK